MQRMSMVIGLEPTKIAEYRRLHAAVWPEILDLISVPIRVSAQVGFGKAVIGLAEPAVLEEWILRHRLA